MAPTIAAVMDPLNAPPRIRIDVAGQSGSAKTVTVTRVNDDGSSYAVRTGNPGSLAGASWTGYDYESPFTQGGTYTATSDTGDACTVTVPSLRDYNVVTPWLIHPGIPALSMPVNVARPGPLPASEINQGVFNVLGRQYPVVRTDGVRRAPTFALMVQTESWDEQAAFTELLSDASTLLLQITYPDWSRGDYYWISVSTVTPSRPVDYFGSEFIQWTLACTVTSTPAGLLQAQWTCAGVASSYASCLAVTSTFATCRDLLINHPKAS